MGDSTHHLHHHQPTASRLGLRNTGGEIVEVQGGHIVRSTGRKDRHSKVCTAKGPRDRRVRLSAHTAIQFYDVQDRLGYDRPSKAVDWLIKKAKAAIDELAELPAWKPTSSLSTAITTNFEQNQEDPHSHHQQQQQQQQQLQMVENENRPQLQIGNHENNSSFLPPSLDSDSIAETIKSFFPMGASTGANSSAMQFQSFPTPDLLSRTSSQSQDLRLSLQSFQDPILLHHHHHNHSQQAHQQHQNHHPTHHIEQATLYTGTPHLGFDGSGWSDNPSGFQRMVAWSSGGDNTGPGEGGGGGGFIFNSPTQTPPFLQPLFGQTQLFSQRGPLQSSNTPSVRAWIDSPTAFSAAAMDHQLHQQTLPFHPSSIGFASGGGFSGFRIPARIQGEEEEHDGISDKPSSASSDSRH